MSKYGKRREREEREEAARLADQEAFAERLRGVYQVPNCAAPEFLRLVDCIGEPAAEALLELIDALKIPRQREN